MTTTIHSRRSNGAGPPTDLNRPRPDPSGRRTRVPELVVGVALAVGFALAGVLWHLSSTDKQAVLALARPVSRGDVIERSDVRDVYLASDDPIAHLTSGQSSLVVGRPARADMAAGTLLTSRSVDTGPTLDAGQGVVGLSLEPGQVPIDRLVPGDLVDVVSAAGAVSPAPETDATASPATIGAAVIAEGAAVYAVDDVGAQGRRVVSIKLAKDDANRVAAAAERGAIRLVLVGRP